MLASITPLGERGRRQRWGVTVTAFVIGATAAGAALGALLGAVGTGLDRRLIVPATAIALLLDATRRVPGPGRQVNERWLDEYRGWVYGLGFGAQLGVGVTTVVSSAATYLALIATFLAAKPWSGALIMGCYGAIRGLTPLAGAGVRSPDRLVAL